MRFLTAGLAALLVGGCATRGPLHLYSAAGTQPGFVSDRGPTTVSRLPVFLPVGSTLTGLAYDPFTDCLFLRLAPGNRIRVIDRPARRIKREFTVDALAAAGGGDLAVRPRDGHLFLAHPTEPALVETTRFGEFVRTIALERLTAPPAGVAYDAARDQLLVLSVAGELPEVSVHATDGRWLRRIPLRSAGAREGLAYDPAAREFYVASTGAAVIAVFDEQGELRRTVPAPGNIPARFFDLGERSFVRIF
ncbi:MAG: hypothetical protein HY302_06930 [Opitutae bacterium]|nr:hypothetical protein [Opitutae bacterium]